MFIKTLFRLRLFIYIFNEVPYRYCTVCNAAHLLYLIIGYLEFHLFLFVGLWKDGWMKGKLYQEELFYHTIFLFYFLWFSASREKVQKLNLWCWEEAFFKKQEKTLLKLKGLGHQINIYFYLRWKHISENYLLESS